MDLRNCHRCGKPFLYVGQHLCDSCLEEEEEAFNRVRQYLAEHPGSSIEETVEATGVERSDILRFLRQGRLQVEGGAKALITCQRCGAPIPGGRFCNRCAALLEDILRAAVAPEASEPPGGGDARGRVYVSDRVYRGGHDKR